MLRTGEHYLNSLNDGRVVWVGNTKIDNVATHPLTRDYAKRTAEFFDLHHRGTAGPPDLHRRERRAPLDDLVSASHQGRARPEAQISRIHHEALRRGVDARARPNSQNYMLVTYIDDPEPWEKASIGADGRGLADNIRNFWQQAMDHDLVVAPHFVDPQADRSDPNAHANSPALRILVDQRRRHPRQRREGDRHGFRVRRFPASRRVLPSRRQGRPDHLRRLPGQPERHHHRLPREPRGRPIRSSIRSPRRATSSTPP